MENKPCTDCKKTNLKDVKIGIVLFGFYLLGSAVYGTYHIIKNLLNLF